MRIISATIRIALTSVDRYFSGEEVRILQDFECSSVPYVSIFCSNNNIELSGSFVKIKKRPIGFSGMQSLKFDIAARDFEDFNKGIPVKVLSSSDKSTVPYFEVFGVPYDILKIDTDTYTVGLKPFAVSDESSFPHLKPLNTINTKIAVDGMCFVLDRLVHTSTDLDIDTFIDDAIANGVDHSMIEVIREAYEKL